MRTFTTNEAQRNLDEVMEAALQAPVAITRDGRRSAVITSLENYRAHAKVPVEDFVSNRSTTFACGR
jgi:prevent-host-death family protein